MPLNPVLKGRESLAKTESFRHSERPCLKKECGELPLASTGRCMDLHMHQTEKRKKEEKREEEEEDEEEEKGLLSEPLAINFQIRSKHPCLMLWPLLSGFIVPISCCSSHHHLDSCQLSPDHCCPFVAMLCPLSSPPTWMPAQL